MENPDCFFGNNLIITISYDIFKKNKSTVTPGKNVIVNQFIKYYN